MGKSITEEVCEDVSIIKKLKERFEGSSDNGERQRIANTIVRESAFFLTP